MKRLILIFTLAALVCLFVAGQALSAGNQNRGMGSSGSVQGSGMMGEGQHSDMMGAGQHSDMMGEGPQHGMMGINLNPEQIREAQRLLNGQGLKAGPADGIYGKQTRAAIRNFQQSQKLVITGKLDSPTLRALAPTTEKQKFLGLSPTNAEQKNNTMELLPEPVKVKPTKE